jgi:hypothetical protein
LGAGVARDLAQPHHGIWQPVWLEPVGATHIADLRWTPDAERGILGLRVALNKRPERRSACAPA